MSDRRTSGVANARITIDLAAIAANWRTLAAMAPDSATGAAVKADGYGLGLETVMRALAGAGCRHFFVANAGEAFSARAVDGQAEIFMLSGLDEADADDLGAARIVPVVNSFREAQIWALRNDTAGTPLPCALHFDTGLNRLGLRPDEAERLAGDPSLLQRLAPGLAMSHFACADDPHHPMNGEQAGRFRAILARLPKMRASLANSAGILQQAGHGFDLTRPGIALYGGEAIDGGCPQIRPAVRFDARILQVYEAKRGESVGYGATQVLERDSVIAVAGAGYADGLPRAASGSGVAMRKAHPQGGMGAIGGRRVPYCGRVSMDLCAFDVTDLPPGFVRPGGWVEIFGDTIALDDFARAAGTIGYEVLTGLSRRAERILV
jgi:alanine racemase